MNPTAYRAQTAAATMERIEAGVDAWVAYRDFLEDWTHLPDSRRAMAASPALARSAETARWAVLMAATVEALCLRDELPVPAWAQDPRIALAEPWYLYRGGERMRSWLRASTPAPFARRNVWSGDRILRRA